VSNVQPDLVHALRGGITESIHRGAIAIVDADGALVQSLGEVDRPIFPRSACKVLQALPLVASGAADAFGLSDEELALACASHGGDARHVAAAARTGPAMMARSRCWRAQALSPGPCTTTAPANTRALSASAA
jgi:L-asparaginase II